VGDEIFCLGEVGRTRTATIAPSGAQVDSACGTSGRLEDIFNRISTLKAFGAHGA